MHLHCVLQVDVPDLQAGSTNAPARPFSDKLTYSQKGKEGQRENSRKKALFQMCWENAYDLTQTGECYWLARVLSLSGLCKVLEQLVQKETVGSGQLFSLCFAAIPAK